MAEVQYTNAIDHLLHVVPDIRQYYEKRLRELHAEGLPHVVYGSIFVEYINSIADRLHGTHHTICDRLLKDSFRLIEELSASTDFEVRCLVETSVLETLLGEQGGLERFASYMGSETKKIAREIAQAWGLNVELLA